MTRGESKIRLPSDGIAIRTMPPILEGHEGLSGQNGQPLLHDVTREVAKATKEKQLTPEQVAEIHAVKSHFSPWTHIYLLKDKKFMQEAGAEKMLIKFNEELDKSIYQQPRQHASELLAKSFENTKMCVLDNPQMNLKQKVIYLKALDMLKVRITGILSGKELHTKQKELVAINTKIAAFKTHSVEADIKTLVKGLDAKHKELTDINQMIDAFQHITNAWQTQAGSRDLPGAKVDLAEYNNQKASIDVNIKKLKESLERKREQLDRVKSGKENEEDKEYFNTKDKTSAYERRRTAIEKDIKRLQIAAETPPPPPDEATSPKS